MNTDIEEEEEKEEEDVAQLGPWGVSSKLFFFSRAWALGDLRTITIIFVVVCLPESHCCGKTAFLHRERASFLFILHAIYKWGILS